MQRTEYGKDIYNGDLGFIARIDPERGELVVDVEGREVASDVGELDELVPAYATTVHKAQGSEYPAVIIPLVTQHRSMLRRNLVYTAITRGKRLVVVVGQPKALAIAVRGARAAALVEARGVARRRRRRRVEPAWEGYGLSLGRTGQRRAPCFGLALIRGPPPRSALD